MKTIKIRIYPNDIKKIRTTIMPNIKITDAERIKILMKKATQ
jgi:hypothetical protein